MNFKNRLYLFWKIGESVFKNQKYFDNVVSKYSNDLSYRYGMSNTFSISNVHYMRKFYYYFPIYISELDKLSFEHYKLLINITEVDRRYFYFRLAMFCRSSVDELNQMISNNLYNYI